MPPQRMIVIGSGLSGLACATRLLDNGHTVTMLDRGNACEGLLERRVSRYLTNRNHDDFIRAKVNRQWGRGRSNAMFTEHHGTGFDYCFAEADRFVLGAQRDAIVCLTLALGGLSNVWGGSILPARDADICDWPISASDLKPYHHGIATFMPLSAARDDLSTLFDFPLGEPHRFPLGEQARSLLQDMEREVNVLRAGGMHFGRAKLAMDPGNDTPREGFACGPIFNAAFGISRLRERAGFTYIPGLFVDHISEENDEIRVAAIGGGNNEDRIDFRGRKVFVACGPLASTQLIAKSLAWTEESFEFRTNQNIIVPFLRYRRQRGLCNHTSNGMVQLFLEVEGDARRLTHFQINQFGDYALIPLRRLLGRLLPPVTFLLRPLLERLMIFQGFLHSNDSDTIRMRFSGESGYAPHKLDIDGSQNPRKREALYSALRTINRHHRQLRGVAVSPLAVIDLPGGSSHLGGSIPMRRTPGPRDCDVLGRPGGCRNIHIVDAAILPSLPAPTISFTTMSNAARIADHAMCGQD